MSGFFKYVFFILVMAISLAGYTDALSDSMPCDLMPNFMPISDPINENGSGVDIGCPGCPLYNGGNCQECCTSNGYSGGGRCGGIFWSICYCAYRG